MANIPGTNLAAGIVPFTSDDTYPTHYAMYGKGGHRTVQSIVNRNSIPTTLKEEGMTVFVLDDNTKYTWKKNPNNSNIVEWIPDPSIAPIVNNTQILNINLPSSVLYSNITSSELTPILEGNNIKGITFQNNIGNADQYVNKIVHIKYSRVGASDLEDFIKIQSNTVNNVIFERASFSVPTGNLISLNQIYIIEQTVIPNVDITYIFENGEYSSNITLLELPSTKQNYILNNIRNSMNVVYVSTNTKINAGNILIYYQYLNGIHPYNDPSIMYSCKKFDANQGEFIWKIIGTIDQ